MQAAGRSCSRVLRTFSQTAAASSENSRVITQNHESSFSGLYSCSSTASLLAPLPSLQAYLQSPGAAFQPVCLSAARVPLKYVAYLVRVIPKHHPPCAESCCGAGHSITTSTAASQKQIDAATREDWQSLTQEQKKQALKPEKNRNHFKRMWKKDLQIKVKCVVPSRYAPRFCITSVASFLP